MTNEKPRIESRIIIPYEKGELIVNAKEKGPGNYRNVGQKVLEDGERLQTGYETTLMLKPACELDEPEFQNIKKVLKKNWLWVYQVDFWLPVQDRNSGVYKGA